MKKTAKLVLKGLLVIVLFTGSTIALTTIGVKAVNEAKAAVSYEQVYKYLTDRGYVVNTLDLVDGRGPDWVAKTVLNGINYNTTVHVQGDEIVGNTDVPM